MAQFLAAVSECSVVQLNDFFAEAREGKWPCQGNGTVSGCVLMTG